MAIIGQVERKNWKVKLLNVCIHMILIVGAATMVYPLLLMMSGSFKSYVDFKNFSVFPEYITVKIPGIVDTSESSEEMLFKKHVYSKYNGTATAAEAYFKEPGVIIDNLMPPKTVSKKRIDDYSEFLALKRMELPHYWRVIGMADEMGVYPLSLRNYREFMQKKFGDDKLGLEKMNNEYYVDYTSWDSIFLLKENFFNGRAATSYTTGMLPSILEFKDSSYMTPLTTVWPDFDANFISTLRRECAISLAEINQKLGTDYNSWEEITIPHTVPENPELAKVWSSFVKNEINLIFVHIDSEAASPAWREFLKEKYADIDDVNAIHRANWTSFDDVVISSNAPEMGQLRADWNMFLTEYAKPEDLTVDTLGLQYRDWLQGKYPSLNALNQAYGNGYSTFEEIKLMDLPPKDSNLKMTTAWNEFVLTLPPKEIALARQSAMDYRKFIIEFYTNEEGETDFEQMSADYKYTVKGENYVPTHIIFPESGPRVTPKAQEHYLLAINDARFRSQYRLDKPEKFQVQWTEFLKAKYSGDITALNEDWRLYETDWSSIALPTKEYEWDLMLQNKSVVTKEFLKRNYLMVFETLITNGDAALNTVIYCFLAVAAALLVNPLCAYGLSRYKPAASYKILLFLMLPMAFPGMVLGIPQFLLVKNLGLLNTFAALILPGMANGYSIFLLKGFFDSLPKELFESAAIDGASEWTVFWHIAMGLSTPILSVLALGAFTGAYGNFMLAFLLCQEKSMWTMMVYLYQLQQRASQAVGFAALLIAAIPTLIVFIFCQNIIIKGIVVPTEK